MTALQDVAILVTRPERQAATLCRLLECEGANVVRLPALSITAAGQRCDLAARLNPVDKFNLCIFTSANAVHFGVSLLDHARAPALAAIGPATARALTQAGLQVTVTARDGFDSEHLLLHPALQRLDGQRILIIKGERGRELLQERLAQRGAEVVIAEVYRREAARYGAARLAALEARFVAGGIDVVTATSIEVVAALMELATPSMRHEFDGVHWLVPSARVAAGLSARGIRGPLIQARSAEDHDLVAAIKRWRSSVSGA